MINRKIAISAVSILTAFTMLGASAFAAFSATNTNQGNSFSAGSLTLEINGQTPTSTGVIQVTGKVPGDVVGGALALHNSGTIPESNVVLTGVTVGGANPELASDLTLQFFADTNGNGVMDAGETSLGTGHLNDGIWTGYTLPGVSISAASTYHLGAQITFDAGARNTDQGKSLTFDLAFQANQ